MPGWLQKIWNVVRRAPAPTATAAAGARGEQAAADFLASRHGFAIVARNGHRPSDRRDEIDLVCRDGEVLVAPTTSPEWMPALMRAAAVVTDTGGMASHAAIVARERRIPCVVGVAGATERLVDGEVVTVDGSAGTVSRSIRS